MLTHTESVCVRGFYVQGVVLLTVISVYLTQIRNVETNQCLDNMARKENEKVGIFNCHGMGGNQVNTEAEEELNKS